MVGLKIQTLNAWLLFWVLTYFLYLSHAAPERRCQIHWSWKDGNRGSIVKLRNNRVRFTCKDTPENVISVCGEYGNWNPFIPECKELLCHVSGDFPAQMFRSQGGFTIICDADSKYHYRECQTDKWNSALPGCRGCFEPPAIDNGWYNGSFLPESKVSYFCDSGYELQGKKEVVCGSSGMTKVYTWLYDRNPPKCVKTKCPSPPVLPNGIVSAPSREIEAKAFYKCNEGFEMKGPQTRQCLANKTWSKDEIICQEKECPAPPNLPNGSVSAPSRKFKASATYECDEGFERRGPKTRQCLANQTWSTHEITCQVIKCPEPPSLSNGSFSAPSLEWKAKATYKCNDGFELVGSKTKECLSNKKWSSHEITCAGVKNWCPAPPDLPNGYVIGASREVGGKAAYDCYAEFELIGPQTRQCLLNKTWSKDEISCQAKQWCPPPPNLPNGSVSAPSRKFEAEATYKCNEGFELRGRETRRCLSNNKWSSHEITCEVIKCPPPPSLSNGSFSAPSLEFNASATYECNEGFERRGPQTRQCLLDKTWSKDEIICQVIKCPPPPNLPNGFVSAPSLEWKGKATYVCKKGFLLLGPKVRQCLANRTWSEEQIICQESPCSIPENFPGEIHKTPGGSLMLVCKGTSHGIVIECLDTGKWGDDIPNCKGCRFDPEFRNGKYNDSLPSDGIFPYLTYLNFECVSGYKLEGEPVSVCHPNETWIPPLPRCNSGGKSGSFLPLKCCIVNIVCLFMWFLFSFLMGNVM